MKIKETKTVREEVVVGYKCDVCGTEFLEDRLVDVSAHHTEWGNDSCDSYEHNDVCSPECYIKLLEIFIDDFSEYDSATIDDKPIEFIRELISIIKGANNEKTN